MEKRNKELRGIYKYLISLGLFMIVSLLILASLYKMEFKADFIGDSLFISNMIIFIISIGVNLGAGNIFNPLKYTAKRIFKRTKTGETPETYLEYIEDKQIRNQNYSKQPWYVTYASGTLLIVAFIFTII